MKQPANVLAGTPVSVEDVILDAEGLVNDKQFQTLTIGTRIPRDYFVTKGAGECDITVHAGSFHLALRDAGVERYNIMTYSSIMPGIAREVKRPKDLVHGCVMETIMACANVEKGVRATAGIIYGWLFNRKTNQRYGGLVCEYNGSLTEEEAGRQLRASLQTLYRNGFDEDYELREERLTMKSFVPKKKYGTALVAICFTNYVYPVLSVR
ncbi:MAG: arginine decarboxylase [Candidatus Omnitrophica bacterium]|nr:arginine decarboxylase [Candidatus Omnitrophota bacterium]